MADMTDLQEIHSTVRNFEIFRYLSDEELNALIAAAESLTFEKGEKIIGQGEFSEDFFSVIDGSVGVSIADVDQEEMFITRIGVGDVFGETAIFVKEARTANVTALEPTRVLRIERKKMIGYIAANPHAGNKILMVIILSLISKLKNANQEIALEKQPEIDSNYVDTLIEEFMNEI